jgi:hypothetical protein
MKKKHLIMLGFLGLVMSLLPATAFASTSTTTQAKTRVPHVFFSKGQTQNHNQSGTASSTMATATTSPNLQYHAGGTVMNGIVNVYIIYWQPSNNVSSGYHTLINRYFNDVGNSNLYKIGQQYKDGNGNFPTGSVVAGTWTDTNPYPGSALYDTDIQNEVTRAQTSNTGWTSGMNNIFFVFTEKNENVCAPNGTSTICTSSSTNVPSICAYHSFFGTNTIYAAMPYAASFDCNPELSGASTPNHDSADLTINVTSHEQMEAATDPLLNAWYDSNGNEIGDKCAWTFGPVNSQGGDVNWNTHNYLVQQEWNNATTGCALTTSTTRQYYKIVNRKSGQVMDVYRGGTNAGAQVIQWPFKNGTNQKWYLQPYGDTFQIVNEHSGLVMDVYGGGTTEGVNVIQWTNHYGNNQQWFLDPEGGYNVIVNLNSHYVADVSGASTTAGAHVIQWGYKNGYNQQWALVPVAG